MWVAPTVFVWVRFVSRLVPGSTISVAVFKALLDQITYGPFSICTFYWGMSVLEGKNMADACDEVSKKLVPTWKVSQS